jgi:hypothetical protein
MRYLEPDEYARWDDLVENSPQGSIFCRSWWLNAVGTFRILGYFEGDELIAGIPLVFESRYGIRVCTMPRLTRMLGVVIRELPGSERKAAARQHVIVGEIAKKLSEYRLFFQAMHPTLVDWRPFYWAGFRQTTRYTFVIDDLTDMEKVWDGLTSNTRKQITKAQKAGLRLVPCGIDDVYRCEQASHSRQGISPRHTPDVLRRIYDAVVEHSSGAAWAVVDQDENVTSAWFIAWDKNRAYGLVGGNDSRARESGAGFLGIWHDIQIAAEQSRSYDFCGSMIEGVGNFNRGFGARPVPYHFIVKAPPALHCALQIAGKL